jgi:hypothetical protein
MEGKHKWKLGSRERDCLLQVLLKLTLTYGKGGAT